MSCVGPDIENKCTWIYREKDEEKIIRIKIRKNYFYKILNKNLDE